MDTDNVPGVTESQISFHGILAEIRSQAPGTIERSHYFNAHHTLLARLTPKPSISVGYFENGSKVQALSSKGNVVFHPAGIPMRTLHEIRNCPTRAVIIHFTPAKFAEMFEEGYPYSPESMASLDVREVRVRYAMRRVADEIMNPGFATPFLIESIATGVMIHMARQFGETHKSSVVSGGLAAWQLRTIEDRLEAIADDNLPSASELAALIDVSPRHLRRAFQASTGQGIGRYIQTLRVQRAKRLLADSSIPLKEIALRLGFAACNSFTVAFLRETGLTPSFYRRNYSALPQKKIETRAKAQIVCDLQ